MVKLLTCGYPNNTQARIHKYAPKAGTTAGEAGKAVKKGEGGEEVKDASS
jgi:hypothetical protein